MDVDLALRKAYDRLDGKKGTFAQQGGRSTIVVTGTKTTVASSIPPCSATPDWLNCIATLSRKEQATLLDDAVRALIAAPAPHVILQTGNRPLTLNAITLGEGTVVIVNEPDGTTVVDSVRIRRAKRALKIFGSPGRAREAQKLIEQRTAEEADEANRKIRGMIGRLKVDNEAFFDAIDLLDGVTTRELKFAGEAP